MDNSRVLLRRSFVIDDVKAEGDGRTILGRVVPYNVCARVRDGDGPAYEESFAPGAFTRATKVPPQRIVLGYEHRGGLLDTIGYATAFDEQEDGLYGSFRALERSLVADQALAMIEAEMITGFSVGFVPLGRGKRGARGEVIRIACHLDEVSLVREPAYADASITAVRSAHPSAGSLADLRPRRDESLDDRLKALRERS